MLDMKWIRAHADEVQAAADGKKINISIRALLERDEERRALCRKQKKDAGCGTPYQRISEN